MANVYTTSAAVLAETTSDIPASAQALIPGWISDESRVVDAALPNYLTPFNDIGAATLPTPPIVEQATRLLVLDRLFRNLQLLRYDEKSAVNSYRVEGERILRQLREGDLVIPASQLP